MAEGIDTKLIDIKFAGQDAMGNPINDVAWSGESCSRPEGGGEWNCEDLSNYNWSHMHGYSASAHYGHGEYDPPAPRALKTFGTEIEMTAPQGTTCAESAHVVKNIHQISAPVGYTPSQGNINICLTKDGWTLDTTNSDPGDGSKGITFTPLQGDDIATVTFTNEKGPGDNYGNTPRYQRWANYTTARNLPNIASVDYNAREKAVSGIGYNGTVEEDTDGDGKLDRTTDLASYILGRKEDGTPYTSIDLGEHSFDSSMATSLSWGAYQGTTDSCENTPARITLWEIKAAAGYQPIQGKAVICATKDGWKQMVTPDGPTGYIKFDKGAHLVRFASVKDTPATHQPDTITVPYGESGEVDVLKNDTASNGGTLDASTLTLLDEKGNAVESIKHDGVTYTVKDGKILVTSTGGFKGEDAKVNYQVKDSNGVIITDTLTATIGNATPVAKDDAYTTEQGKAVSGNLLDNDDAGSPKNSLDPSTVKLTGDDNGTWSVDKGVLTFVPKDGFTGTAKGSYTVRDILGNETSANITVVVTARETTVPTPEPTTPPTTENPTPTDPGTTTPPATVPPTTPGTVPPTEHPATATPTEPGNTTTPSTPGSTDNGSNTPVEPITPGPVVQTDHVSGPGSTGGAMGGAAALGVLGGAAVALRRRLRGSDMGK